MRFLCAALAFSTVPLLAGAEQPQTVGWEEWEIRAQESRIEEYKGERALFLRGGTASLRSAQFRDGIIEFDVAIPIERGFSGVSFRCQDDQNYENFYIRHHQSGKPDANQYTPVFHGSSAWQLYHGPHFSSPTRYRHNEWMHIKLVISGNEADIYVDDMETPTLFVPQLMQKNESGWLTVNSGFAPARFANFVFQQMTAPKLVGSAGEIPQPPDNLVSAWSISSLVSEDQLAQMTELPSELLADLSWTALATESTGIANLARVQAREEGKTAAFAKITITSERDQSRHLDFGYSDRAFVFVNGDLVYTGQRNYRSRDYRYLGTIGLFDTLTLRLQEGRNEVVVGVGESFGGWGIIARLDSVESLTIAP